MTLLLPGPLPVLIGGLLVVLAAGIVRGFAGFGFAALAVAGLSLFVAPATVVPALLALEVLASVSLLRRAARDADRGWLGWLLLGNAVCIPLGMALLAYVPEAPLRGLVAGALLLSALGLRLAGSRTLAPTRGLRVGAGVVSGVLTGVAASGGVVAAMLMAGARLPPAALRGTMITFLLFAGSYALLCAGLLSRDPSAKALLGVDTLRWALLLAPAMLAGIWIGQRSFAGADPARYRGFVLNLLIAIAGLGVLRSALDLWRG